MLILTIKRDRWNLPDSNFVEGKLVIHNLGSITSRHKWYAIKNDDNNKVLKLTLVSADVWLSSQPLKQNASPPLVPL